MKFKFLLEQTVYYMQDNRVHSAQIFARHCVENLKEDYAVTKAQAELFTPFGPAGVFYATCHGTFNERDVYGSKEELAAALVEAA